MTRGAYLLNLGTVDYREALSLQRSLAAAVSQGAVPDVVVLLEHPRGLAVQRDYDVSIPEFRGDREQLIQAVLNIAQNAAFALAEVITIKSIETAPCVNPATFNANLKAGKVADVFYVYNTDAQDVINKGQAKDIQQFASSIPGYSDIIPAVRDIFQKGNSLVGCVNGALSDLKSAGTLQRIQDKWLAKVGGAPVLK